MLMIYERYGTVTGYTRDSSKRRSYYILSEGGRMISHHQPPPYLFTYFDQTWGEEGEGREYARRVRYPCISIRFHVYAAVPVVSAVGIIQCVYTRYRGMICITCIKS